MTTYQIPIPTASILGAFKLTVDLDGVDYEIRFQFNSREEFWYYDLLTSDGTYLQSGVKVVSNFPTTRLVRSEDRPPGELITIDTRTPPLDPGLEDLDLIVSFGYEDEDGIDAL